VRAEDKILRAFAGKSRRGWPTTADDAERMRHHQRRNRRWIWSEQEAAEILGVRSIWDWTRQACWGNRIFDFWDADLGVAIEIDGPEHQRRPDLAQDRWHARRSAIATFRVRNGDERQLARVIDVTNRLRTWPERRRSLLALARRMAGSRTTPSPAYQQTEQQP
jgi:very-short-patch-repair endonuclease